MIHTRYDQLSIDRSIELILGMRPLGLQDALAMPMYDAFTSTPVNSVPFAALPESTDLLARNSDTALNRRMTARLDFTHLDAVPQHTFDNALWKYVTGRTRNRRPPVQTRPSGQTPRTVTTDRSNPDCGTEAAATAEPANVCPDGRSLPWCEARAGRLRRAGALVRTVRPRRSFVSVRRLPLE